MYAIFRVPGHSGTAEPQLSENSYQIFVRVIRAFAERGIPFLLAGSFAQYYYSGLWRETSDLDLLILPQDRDRAVAALVECELCDWMPKNPYDPGWIYRGIQGNVIVDIIWQAANYAGEIDASWIERGQEVTFLGERVKVVSAADLCWLKMAIMEYRRCDWLDIFNIILGTSGELDWDHWIAISGEYVGVVQAIVFTFDTIFPRDTRLIPDAVRYELEKIRDLPQESNYKYLFGGDWPTQVGSGLSRLRDQT